MTSNVARPNLCSRRRPFSSISTSSSTSQQLCIISKSDAIDLINNQRWSLLHTNCASPPDLLRFFFHSHAPARTLLLYFQWSQRQFALLYDLDLLLLQLVDEKRYPDLRRLVASAVRGEYFSVPSFFHSLAVSGQGWICSASIVADMLVLACAKSSLLGSAMEAFDRAGQYEFRSSVLICNALLSGLLKENRVEEVEVVYKQMRRRFCTVGKLQKAEVEVQEMVIVRWDDLGKCSRQMLLSKV